MAGTKMNKIIRWLVNEEQVYSLLFAGIAVSLIFWPLLNSICCIAVFVYWLFFSKKQFSVSQSTTLWTLLFGLLFIVVLVGALYSEDSAVTLFKVQLKVPLLLFPLVMGTSKAVSPLVFKRTLTIFTCATAAGCLACMANGLYVFIETGSADRLQGYNMFVLKDMNPFVIGLCCLLSLFFTVNELFTNKDASRSRIRTGFATAMIAVLILFLFLLGNRSALFCFTGLILYYGMKRLQRRMYRFLLIALLALAFIAAVQLNPFFRSQWKDLVDFSPKNAIQLDKDESLGRDWGGKTIRLTIWQCSWDIIREHWLTGVGTGDVQTALQTAYEERKFYFASRYNRYNAHNQYIEETIAHGIAGLLIFLACLFLPLWAFFRKEQHTLYVLFLLCLSVVCLTESILELNKGIILYSFFNSIFIFRKFKL